MELDAVAKALKELGHPTRLTIFRRLVRAGHNGIAVGDVQDDLSIPGSTLSHHLSSLMSAGLITQRREGRVLYCVPQFEQLEAVLAFLQDECCVDEEGEAGK
ncbi:ArsR/SmtB family transcription factor [Enterovibrio norvegicus]|uniref:ArsR/SmtB family transcription factor n=1 Tax=Enterovibrio norvegicus TaxID=188144 RepID=UPI0013D55163|nr:metalloregulator ArsR/SmtB family transcription factor [Enterovibrio norvegicus]